MRFDCAGGVLGYRGVHDYSIFAKLEKWWERRVNVGGTTKVAENRVAK